MQSLRNVAEVAGAIWLTSVLLWAFGYPLYGMLSGAKPSDPSPKIFAVFGAVAVAPKVLIAAALWAVFVLPFDAIS